MRRLTQAMYVVLGMVWSVGLLAEGEATKLWENSPHADIGSPSFTHWNNDGVIPGRCASCHSGTGFLDYLGADESEPFKMDKDHATGTVVDCLSCHHAEAEILKSVPFPSGVVVSDIESSATCMVCHQGRSSTNTVMEKVGDAPEDEVNTELSFINIHYRAAAATLFGTEVKGGFEYPGKTYAGRFAHVDGLGNCADCHNPHSLIVTQTACAGCHKEDTLDEIRMNTVDADADGDVSEGVASEITTIHKQLSSVISEYASSVINKLIYQFVAKDPGAYAHNPAYVTQILIDSVNDIANHLGLDDNGYKRPD